MRPPDEAELAYRQAMARLDPFWQEEQAERQAQTGQWFAATFHLDRLLQARPDDALARYRLGLVRLTVNDVSGHARVCKDMRGRFGESLDPEAAAATASLGTLLPDAVKDAAPLVKLAKRALDSQPDDAGYRVTLGAALFRAGRPEEAVPLLEGSLKKQDKNAAVATQLFLALAHHRLKHAAEARQWLNKAVEGIEQATKAKDEAGQPVPVPWENRVRWQVLRAEAETLLKSPPP